MQIVKVLNNSLLLVEDDQGHEQILMGRGIGYNKAVGNEVGVNDIEKTFVLKDKKISKQIVDLAGEIDQVYFNITKQTIDYSIEKYKLKLSEYIFLSLTDHLAFALSRIKKGLLITNDYTNVIKKYNPIEFDVGKYAKHVIYETLQIEIPDDEVAFIASHFINAQNLSSQIESKENYRLIVDKILSIVEESLDIKLNTESFNYSRFLLHLQLFSMRILDKNEEKYNNEESDDLLNILKIEYPNEAVCVEKINRYINEEYHLSITNSEKLYLLVHIRKTYGDIGGNYD